MKTRHTIILVAVVLVLWGANYFYDKYQPNTRALLERGQHVLNFKPDQIDGIVITNGEERIELKKEGGTWQMEAPEKDRADAASIEALLSAAQALDHESTITKGGDGQKVRPKDYGLAESKVRLKLSGKEAPPELLFGESAPLEGKMYVRTADADTVYVVANDLQKQVGRKAEAYRDKHLANFTADQVTRFNLRTADGEFELHKADDGWRIEKPLKARADEGKVRDAIAGLVNLTIEQFVAPAETQGLAEPRATFTLSTDAEGKPAVIQIGKADANAGGNVFAKLPDRNAVVVLPAQIEPTLKLQPNDFRERTLVRLNPDTVDRISIESSAGGEPVVLARKEEEWVIKSRDNRPANKALIEQLLTQLRTTPVTDFVADTASDLTTYGLDKPQRRVTFSAFASENTAESNAGENKIATISFGATKEANVFARLEDEPFVVAAPVSLLEAVPGTAAEYQSLALLTLKPEEISTITVNQQNQSPFTLNKTGDAWKSVDNKPVAQVAAQSLCGTLAHLHATRWLPAPTLADGTVTQEIRFTAGQQEHVLKIGAAQPDGMSMATLSGNDGVFLLSAPDLSAIRAPLLPPPGEPPSATSASPAPTAGASPSAAGVN